jgi:hypothetical protein
VLVDLKLRIFFVILVITALVFPMCITSRSFSFTPQTSSSHISGSAQTETSSTGVIVPLYSYPGSEWSSLAKMKEAYPSVPIVAVVDPDDGPGSSWDQNYANGISLLESAGVIVLGYVYTSYAARSITDVKNDVYGWSQMYWVNGVFFDEMSNVQGYESYYSNLNSYASSLGYTFTVGNAGAQVPSGYIGTMDNIVIYENKGLPTISYLSSLGYQKSDFSSLSYGVSSLNTTFVASASSYVSYMYITDEGMPDPYTKLPSYFGTLLSTLSLTVTVQTDDLSGNQIYGLWTVVRSGGSIIQKGFSPLSFTATSGDQYEITVSNYGNYVFNHWNNGSTNRTIMIYPTQATTLVAYYDT